MERSGIRWNCGNCRILSLLPKNCTSLVRPYGCIVAEPALSRQIRQLERELNVLLFDRTTRSVRMTSVGVAFLGEARRALVQIGHRGFSVAQQAQRGEAGQLLVGFSTSAAYDVLPRSACGRTTRAFPAGRD